MVSEIQKARVHAGLRVAEVASAVARDANWLIARESGTVPLDPDHERIILVAIERLARFATSVEEAKQKLTADLKLPPLRATKPVPGGCGPRTPGTHAA